MFLKEINNGEVIGLEEIPELLYTNFFQQISKLIDNKACHCVNYYVVPMHSAYKFICIMANDNTHKLIVLSHVAKKGNEFPSLTALNNAFHIFEREIHENFGFEFIGHPWLKPVRWAHNQANPLKNIDNYPFYHILGSDLHLVGVGPIHAGIIEPGHFRFICNGEKVLHLEIHLGYQHRGIETLMIEKASYLQRAILAESIAGDTAVAHSLSYANVIESLANYTVNNQLAAERVVALELERLAMHIADTGALCTDVAYQFGQVVNEALRTLVINTSLQWFGNRLGKGIVRPMGTNYAINALLAQKMLNTIIDVETRFNQITDRIFTLPTVLDRFEEVGVITRAQAEKIGAVGMAARITGLKRDIRYSHPTGYYKHIDFEPALLETGDVWARAMLRKLEARASIDIVKTILKNIIKTQPVNTLQPNYTPTLQPNAFVACLTEGWRGEICHSAITDNNGNISHYKIKDPSMHNWLALQLAVRDQEISDFPICNKSFNLSYCGYDI